MTAAIPDTLSAEPGAGPSGNDRITKLRRRLLNSSPALMSVVLVLLILFFSIANPSGFATFANARNILMDTAILLVMAVGVTFVMIAAGFDLSIGSVLVFAQVCSVKVMGAMGDQGVF